MHYLLGQSAAILALRRAVDEAARTTFPVFVGGDRGTGVPELVRFVHERGGDGSSFVQFPCRQLSATLSELAPDTSSNAAVSVYLQDVHELSPEQQGALHAWFDRTPVDRVRGSGSIVRLLSSGPPNMGTHIVTGGFDERLFYRLNVLHLAIPPLREHVEDIPFLAEDYFRAVGVAKTLSPKALDRLMGYAWPGNIDELDGFLRDTLVRVQSSVIEASDLPRAFDP